MAEKSCFSKISLTPAMYFKNELQIDAPQSILGNRSPNGLRPS
jgi:hypothetical protein